MTWSQTTANILDAAGNTRSVICYTDGTNLSFAHPLLDKTGAIVAPATSDAQSAAQMTLDQINAALAAGNIAIEANQVTGNALLTTIAAAAPGSATATNQTSAITLLTAIAASVASPPPIPPKVITGSTTTRPADTTTYAFGDLVANSTSSGSVTPGTIAAALSNDFAFTALRLRLKKSGTGITNAIFRVHAYNVLPTVSNGDNGGWLSTQAGYLGSFDVTVDKAFSDASEGIGIPTAGSTLAGVPVSGTKNIYYLIEARAAYTPASAEVFTPILEVQ